MLSGLSGPQAKQWFFCSLMWRVLCPAPDFLAEGFALVCLPVLLPALLLATLLDLLLDLLPAMEEFYRGRSAGLGIMCSRWRCACLSQAKLQALTPCIRAWRKFKSGLWSCRQRPGGHWRSGWR